MVAAHSFRVGTVLSLRNHFVFQAKDARMVMFACMNKRGYIGLLKRTTSLFYDSQCTISKFVTERFIT